MAAQPKESGKPVLGFLHSGSSGAFTKCVDAFLAGLEQGGCPKDGVTIEYRWSDGDFTDELRKKADELVKLGPKVIVAAGGITVARVVRKAAAGSPNISIVFIGSRPRRAGLLPPATKKKGGKAKRRGGNITGVDAYTADSYTREGLAERLELLSKLAPKAKIAVFVNPDTFTHKIDSDAAEEQGKKYVLCDVKKGASLETVFASFKDRGIGAVFITPNALYTSRRNEIVALAEKHKLPALYPWREYVDANGLMSYGSNLSNAYRQVGLYTGLIVNGTSIAQLPVLQPENSPLVINLKAAKAQGIVIPPEMLAKADEIIR